MRTLVIRSLCVFAILLFAGSGVAELTIAEGLPDNLKIAKEEFPVSPAATIVGGLLALACLPIGLVGYVGCFLLQRWAAYVLLAHMLTFVLANLLMGIHVYTGITQALFLAYSFVAGLVLASVLSLERPPLRGRQMPPPLVFAPEGP